MVNSGGQEAEAAEGEAMLGGFPSSSFVPWRLAVY